ncbi:MAG: flagellar biosynthetic protein FliR [Myxococcota bacterium]
MTLDVALVSVLGGLLGSLRVLAMMVVGPLFGHPAISMRLRLSAALLLTWAFAPVATGRLAQADWDVASLAGAAFVELAIGALIGLGAGLVFTAMMLLGEFVAVQGGIGAAQAIDPATGISSPAIGLALEAFAILIFLAIDGHHDLIRGLGESFTLLPVGGALPSPETFLGVARLASAVWRIAVQIAAPVVVAIFVQNVATGVLSRALPQLNILIVNLPLHVGIVMLLLGLGANELIHAMKDRIEIWPQGVFEVLVGGGHGG